MTERLFGRGRRGGVLIIAGAVLGAAIAGPGATIAQKAMNLTTKSADKRYVKRTEMRVAGQTVETPLPAFNSATFTPIAQATVKAPGPGFILINASLSAKDDEATAAGSKLQYRLAVGTTPLSTTPTSFELFLTDADTREDGSIDGFAKVARKGPLDVKLEAQSVGGAAVDILGRSITAQFVPKAKIGTKKKKGSGGGNAGP